jgi:hypothetical protein
MADAAKRLGFGTLVEAVPRWFQAREVLHQLLDCDLIVVTTDTMKSGVFASRVGMQFLIPILSTGIDVVGTGDMISAVGAHVALQLPGGPCLDCLPH